MELNWTGERVIPDQMTDDRLKIIYKQHLARYEFAKHHCIDKSIIDVACGSGYGCDIFRKATNKSIIGIDNDDKTIQYCKERYSDIDFMVTDVENGFDNYPVDIITSFETIEHLNDPNKFLDSVRKTATDKFIFSIPLHNPSEFHKVVYSMDDVKNLIGRYFKNTEYFGQDLFVIDENANDNRKFIIGITRIK